MAIDREPLNGSVELLARAMRQVFTDAVAQGVEPIVGEVACIRADLAGVKQDLAGVKEDVAGVKEDLASVKEDVAGVKEDMKDMEGRLNKRMDNLESNVQAQLAENRRQVAADVRRQLSRR